MHLTYSIISEQMMDKGKFLSLFCGALIDKQFAYMKLF